MKITDKIMRYIVLVVVVVLLLGVGYVSQSGKKQDEQFLKEQAILNQALENFKDAQFDQAIPLLRKVDEGQPNSAVMKNYLALALSNYEEWSSAVLEFQKVLDLNPYKVEDPIFMIQFAEVLVNAEKLEEAKIVLERCQSLPSPDSMPNYQELVNTLLLQISMNS